ncbi:putative quinol monooxygenase, partial [Mycolicibacterium fortuitum]
LSQAAKRRTDGAASERAPAFMKSRHAIRQPRIYLSQSELKGCKGSVMTNMVSETLCNVASFRAKAGKGTDLGEKLAGLVGPSRSESGCLRYELYQADDDADRWLVVEVWRSSDDLDLHMNTAHLAEFLKEVPDLCDQVELQRYREV